MAELVSLRPPFPRRDVEAPRHSPLSGREAVPACLTMTTRSSSSRRPPPAHQNWQALHSLVDPQARLPSAVQHRPADSHRPRHPAMPEEPSDPDFDAKLDRIEYALTERPCAFAEFGPFGIRPTGGSCWARQSRPDRPARHQRPSPRSPRRPTQRTRPHSQRERHPPGRSAVLLGSSLTIEFGDCFRSRLQAGADEPECSHRVCGTADGPAHDNM